MTDRLLTSVDNALAAFGAYQTALDDPEFACPATTLDRLEVAMRNLQDVFDETEPQKGARQMSKLDEIKQAYEAGTKLFPTPWERDEHTDQIHCAEDRGAVVAHTRGWGPVQKANARLIVTAVNELPKLVKVAEAAETLLGRTRARDQTTDHIALREALEAFK